MANDYYERARTFTPFTRARGDDVQFEFDGIEAGFEKTEVDTNRAIKLVDDGTSQEISESAVNRATKVLGFDADGNLVVSAGFTYRGDWATSTEYYVNDVFRDATSKNLYVVKQQHTSGTLSTDITDGKNELAINVEDVEAARAEAENWANTPEDTLVPEGDGVDDFSALHHAAKSSGSASAASTSASNAATSETNAADSASAAATSETNAATSASNSSTSATKSENYAVKNDGFAGGTDNSSKSWSIGGTGDGQPSAGPAKDWATKTSGNVDGAGFSAKEHALGSQTSTGGSSKNWAQQTGGDVTGAGAGDKSAKSWAQETGASAPAGGSARQWATKAEDAEVIAGEFSSLHWSKKAEGWAQGVNLPSATGNALKTLRQKSDESGFEYTEQPYPQSTADGRFAQLAGGADANFTAMPQVGGDPIVESDSNSNGFFTRLADGTQIIHTVVTNSNNAEVSFNYAAPFVEPVRPVCMAGSTVPVVVNAYNHTTSSCTLKPVRTDTDSIINVSMTAVITGRWK